MPREEILRHLETLTLGSPTTLLTTAEEEEECELRLSWRDNYVTADREVGEIEMPPDQQVRTPVDCCSPLSATVYCCSLPRHQYHSLVAGSLLPQTVYM